MEHSPNYGGRMRRVEIRADGVAPVPVADACQQAYKSGPKPRRPHQPKNARGAGRSPAGREAPEHLDASTTTPLRQLFELLDEWDREAARARETV